MQDGRPYLKKIILNKYMTFDNESFIFINIFKLHI